MGYDTCKSYSPPSLSLQDSLVNGQIDLTKHRLYSKSMYDDIEYINTEELKLKSTHEVHRFSKKSKISRSIKRHPTLLRTDDRAVRSVNFKDSV